eukprot:scaffold161799_cov55-Attheya_sp.AAC.2
MSNETNAGVGGNGTGGGNNGGVNRSTPLFDQISGHGGNPLGLNLGQSVVPDLMRVYESLTQSSTPQHPPPPTPTKSHDDNPSSQHKYQARSPADHPHQYQAHYSPGSSYQPAAHHQHPPHPEQGQHPQYGPYPHQQYPACGAASTPFMPPQNKQHEKESPDEKHGSSASTSSGKSARKRPNDGKNTDSKETAGSKRKKNNQSDGRWSKRFTWPEALHREFVAAVFEVGLKHSSPSSILENMERHEQINSERIKSHLQKYRMHKDKSKKDFMASYDIAMDRCKNGESAGGGNKPANILNYGEVAAHLSHSTILDETGRSPPTKRVLKAAGSSNQAPRNGIAMKGGILDLPKLTDAEKQSPIGASMGYLMGLFLSLREQIMRDRAAAANTALHGSAPSLPPVLDPSGHGPPGGDREAYDSTTTSHDHENSSGGVAMYPPFTDQQSWGQQVDPSLSLVEFNPPHMERQQQTQDQDQHEHQSDGAEDNTTTKNSTSTTSIFASLSSAGNNRHAGVNESQIIKREMQSQMAFQNKMRALKQQELNKYRHVGNVSGHDEKEGGSGDNTKMESSGHIPDGSTAASSSMKFKSTPGQVASEGANEAADDGTNLDAQGDKRKYSVGDPGDDFWNTDVVDEQLFEFLMNT